MKQIILTTSRDRRRKRIRSKISGTAERPRFSIYKSNTTMYAQLIDDAKGVTLVSASSRGKKGNKTEASRAVGTEIAKLAKAKGIEAVVFDRGGFIYTGRVKAVADSAREGGLKF